MSLEIVSSTSLLLRDPQDKESHIRKQSELKDGEVMALINACRRKEQGGRCV